MNPTAEQNVQQGGAGRGFSVRVKLPDPKPKLKPPAKPRPATERPGVLVVVHPDRFLEVFATPGVRVHIAEALQVEPPEEILAEKYLEVTLPVWARRLFFPVNRANILMPKPRTPAEEIHRQTAVKLLDILGSLEPPPKPKATPYRARTA